jgi:kanamycin nucleotidyltransferase
MSHGPQAMAHEERWALAEEIAHEILAHYGSQVLAVGVYGSLARGDDGPYSDIEMHCVVRGENIDRCFEWSTGPWKAEVDVYSPDIVLEDAAFVDGDWSITHGAFVNVRPIYDPGSFFDQLRNITLSQPETVFKERSQEVIVGEIYELVGKIRNAWASQAHAMMAVYAAKLALWGVCLLGLHHRRLFTSAGRVFEEALALPDPPDGLHPLVQMTARGELTNPLEILTVSDRLWLGIEAWAERQNLEITTSLQALLSAGGEL